MLVAAFGTAGRTYTAKLLNGDGDVLKHSFRQMIRPSNAESFLAKTYAQAFLGHSGNAFATLHEFEKAYGNSSGESAEELVSPLTSLNSLVVACCTNGFVTLDSRDEATKVYEHFVGLDAKPNAMTYSLLVDAHLIKRDIEGAISVVHELVHAQYKPSKEMLKKIQRRCTREMEYESDDRVESWEKQFNIRMGTENRRNMLHDLEYSIEDRWQCSYSEINHLHSLPY